MIKLINFGKKAVGATRSLQSSCSVFRMSTNEGEKVKTESSQKQYRDKYEEMCAREKQRIADHEKNVDANEKAKGKAFRMIMIGAFGAVNIFIVAKAIQSMKSMNNAADKTYTVKSD